MTTVLLDEVGGSGCTASIEIYRMDALDTTCAKCPVSPPVLCPGADNDTGGINVSFQSLSGKNGYLG
jgi:hypothetical protein